MSNSEKNVLCYFYKYPRNGYQWFHIKWNFFCSHSVLFGWNFAHNLRSVNFQKKFNSDQIWKNAATLSDDIIFIWKLISFDAGQCVRDLLGKFLRWWAPSWKSLHFISETNAIVKFLTYLKMAYSLPGLYGSSNFQHGSISLKIVVYRTRCKNDYVFNILTLILN